jgi:hypothetical protein
MLRLAGSIGDGVVLSAGLSTESVRRSIALCAEGAHKGNRAVGEFRHAGYLFFGVSHEAKKAVDAVRQKLAFVMRNKFLAAHIKESGIPIDQEAVIAAISSATSPPQPPWSLMLLSKLLASPEPRNIAADDCAISSRQDWMNLYSGS